MNRWTVIVELPAQWDIARARLWIAERDPDAAEHWFDSIYDTIGSLEIFLNAVHLRQKTSPSRKKSAKYFTAAANTNTESFLP